MAPGRAVPAGSVARPPVPPGAAGVVQPWQNYIPTWLRRSVAVAAGAVAGTAAYAYTPGSLATRRTAAGAAGLVVAGVTDWMLQPPDYAAAFSRQINNQAAFYGDIDRRLNAGATFNTNADTLTVRRVALQDAATRLRQREREQRALVGAAHAWGRPIFDATIPNHANKNALWRAWMARAGGAAGGGFSERVGTTLARIIATAPGFTLMQQVDAQATALGIPIDFVEEAAGAGFNLVVAPGFNAGRTALTSLTVRVPAGVQYDDAQSFKRSNRRQNGGGHDVRQLGEHLTAAPIDTDLFHEFVHAAHYLDMERRRQAGGGAFAADLGHYDTPVGGDVVSNLQDEVAEAATIHRSASLGDLRQLALNRAPGHPGGAAAPDNPYTALAASIHAIDQLATGAGIPAENDYRVAIGLAPRQDHRALRLGRRGYEHTSADAPIETA
jgi:hypothetical protein